MPKSAPKADERTARLQRLVKAHPDCSSQVIQDVTGRTRKTVTMWKLGKPQAIPEIALRLLEQRFPVTADTAE